MKFLVDAQLPAKLAAALVAAGHDTIHTSELPDGNRTTDARIADVADRDDRVVVTKDRDFRDGHLLSGSPRRLLTIATRQHHQRRPARLGRGTSRHGGRGLRRRRLRRARHERARHP